MAASNPSNFIPNPDSINSIDSFFSSGGKGGGSESIFSMDALSYGFSQNIEATDAPFVGTKSIFNEYSIFRFQGAAGNYALLHDVEGKPGVTPYFSANPSAGNIINWSQEQTGGFAPFGATPYSYSDFLYCTYYGLIPNNYMITLRRFPFPMTDNLKTPDGKSIPPMAQAITWFGEETNNSLKDILKFTFGQNWKEVEADVQNVIGNEKGMDDMGTLRGTGGVQDILGGIQGFLNPTEFSGLAQSESEYAQKEYESEGPYANKVYGPVNVIHKTMVRDRGMHFEGDISLNFNFSLKSIGTVNPKMAMLDIIGNILTLTYNNAKFWGGAIRYFPQYPRKKFMGDQKAFYNGDVGGYINSMSEGFGKLGETLMKTFANLIDSPQAALAELQKLGGGAAKMAMGSMASQNRPQILAMRSLLTGDPVGEWHLVIGNPMNPIAMIGNLICTDVEFELNDELGADDFPTELKVNIKLKHGKPRDKGDIESIFNLGNGRMYYGIKDSVFSSANNSIVDTSGTKGSNNNGKTATTATNNNTPTNAEVASSSQHSNSTLGSTRSMWGNKFTREEFGITNLWSGGSTSSK